MQIRPTGKTDDIFAKELERLVPKKPVVAEKKDEPQATEGQLSEDRKPETLKDAEKPLENKLEKKNEGEEVGTIEQQLRDKKKTGSPNADKEGTTEKRLNEASKDLYPHRNEQAYKQTGNKRPVNHLDEENDGNGDEARRKRYEKANDKAAKEQREKSKKASFDKYVQYRKGSAWNTAKLREVDALMSSIMKSAASENRALTNDELVKISALKQRKSELLGLNGAE